MTHARKQIRDAVRKVLKTNNKWKLVTGTRLPSSRNVWPYLMVFAINEDAEADTVNNPVVYQRDVNISVAGMLRLPGTGDTIDIEDQMDEIADEIEKTLTQSALRTQLTTSVPIQYITLINTNLEVVTEEEVSPDHAEVILTWQIGYSTAEGAPGILI